METGFLNKHDSEYFSTDGYEQSNGFESENSLLNVFTIDYVDRIQECNWIIPEEIHNSNKPQKQFKEDFRKTFEDWQQHISSLQSRDEAFTDQLLCSPIPDDMPDIGASLSIPMEKIKTETFIHDEVIVRSPLNSIKKEEIEEDDEQLNINSNEINDRTLFVDKNTLNDLENLLLEQTPQLENVIDQQLDTIAPILVKQEIDSPKEELLLDINPNSPKEMPILSPEQFDQSNHEIFTNKNKPEITAEILPTTADLGPDNYDVVEIKVEPNDEEVQDTKPVIEAVNLDNLLEQFEASEKIVSRNHQSLIKFKNETLHHSTEVIKNTTSTLVKLPAQTNKQTKDTLPQDVIDRIKDSSSKKKGISVVPAARLPAKGYNHMKDAGATKNRYSSLAKPGESLLIKEETAEISETGGGGLIKGPDMLLPIGESGVVNVKEEVLEEEPKKKRKLNLEEYRTRRKNKPVSPTKSSIKSEINGFKNQSENGQTGSDISTEVSPSLVHAEVQTQISDDKKEDKKRESSKDRKGSRPLQRYRRRSSSSSSSSSGSRYRSRRRRERSRRRRYSKGHEPRSHSRSRSSSSARSLSSSSSVSRSRSRSRSSKYRYRSRNGRRRSNYSSRYSRYSQERLPRRHDDWSPIEKMRQIEERRVIYVGQIEEGTTKSQLRERFETFGPVIDISLHFRERGDNYGFVTFAYKMDAYRAVEHGNDYPMEPHYDICFGGRRAFCKQRYSDLDGISQVYSSYHQNHRANDSFDMLLREAQEKLRKQKHV